MTTSLIALDEPLCCNTPMVHNSWTQEYECSDAYFALVQEGYDELALVSVTEREWIRDRRGDLVAAWDLVKTLRHWRASRTADETLAAAVRERPVDHLDLWPEVAREFYGQWRPDLSKPVEQRYADMEAFAIELLTRAGVLREESK